MGIWKSFVTGLPTLNLSDFQSPLSSEKRRTLLHYALYIQTDGKAFENGASPSESEMRSRLASFGIDANSDLQLRAFIIRYGLMSPSR